MKSVNDSVRQMNLSTLCKQWGSENRELPWLPVCDLCPSELHLTNSPAHPNNQQCRHIRWWHCGGLHLVLITWLPEKGFLHMISPSQIYQVQSAWVWSKRLTCESLKQLCYTVTDNKQRAQFLSWLICIFTYLFLYLLFYPVFKNTSPTRQPPTLWRNQVVTVGNWLWRP